MKISFHKMEIVSVVLQKSLEESSKYKPITVEKHIEVEYDLGSLFAFDRNALDAKLFQQDANDYLLDLTRDNTQLLFNQIWELPTERVEEAVVAKLPTPTTVLPRSKPVPKPRELTKWEQFAKEKGIQKKKKSKLSWDDQLQKWVPLYGFKRTQAEKEKNWVLEVPQNADPTEDQFAKKTVSKSENVAKNELQRLRNIAKRRNIKIPRVGLTNPEVACAKDLQAAVTVAKASTASLGKFQDRLPKEKEATGVATITPGASRKRKLPPVTGDVEKKQNLDVVEAILNKRPKFDVEKSVSKQIQTKLDLTETTQSDRMKGGKKNQIKSKASKKPKGSKGQRAGGKMGGGRKRR